MEKANASLARTKSEELVETVEAAFKSPMNNEAIGVSEGGDTLSSMSSKRLMTAASPGRSTSGGSKNTHIRKSRSAQMKFELDDISSGAALSRASSASLGFSFSFTGFSMPPDEIVDSMLFSEDDLTEDLEAGMRKPKFQTEPTLPIFLKAGMEKYDLAINAIHRTWLAWSGSVFRDVTSKVIIKGMTSTEEKDILNGISGSVEPGEVLALMGPSGSGKTTLLNLLGGRLNRPTVGGGSITYNDGPYSKFLKSRIGFVTQDDILFPHLTVKETLTYAALLRLPKTLTKEQKKKRAIDVIYELGLERCQDTMIGGLFVRGVSGGERKRVCIGNEIIINPSILFLDEPTSGLDSTTALKTVQLLQDMAVGGKTVVTTIHQPSSRLFHKFDKLILLGKGSLLYFGKSSEAMLYFSSIGCNPLIAMNPAEFLLDLANGNINDISVPSKLEDKVQIGNSDAGKRNKKPSPAVVHEYLVEAYETRVADKEKKKLMVPTPLDEEVKAKVFSRKRQWGASWWQQYTILFCRGIKERRHDYFSWLRITQVLSTAIILGLLWWKSDSNSLKDLQDQAGLLFFIAVFWGFFPVFTAIFTFPQERAMLSKERAADMYRLSAYFLARTTSDLPLDLILPVLFLLVVYFMAGLRMSAASFFLTMLTVFLSIVAAQGLGLAIGATLMDLKRATTLASVTVMTFMLAGGYFVKKVPVFVSWIRYMSFNYHTYKLLLKVQYKHMTPVINGTRIDDGLTEVSALVAMVFGYRLLAYISLRRMKLCAQDKVWDREAMDRLKATARLMIVSDLDHTMVDHHDPENMSLLRFNALWEACYRNDSLLVFSTGRSPTLYKQLRKEKPMLTPDITIMSVGTEITYGTAMVPDDGWVGVLNQKWDRNIVTEEAGKLPELTLQSETEQRPHKVSFYVDKANAQNVTKVLSEIFAKRGLDVKIIYSGGMDLDILPQGAGKGQALAYLHKKFKTEGKLPANTLVCGDSGNDAELFSIPDVHGVMVSNAQEELLQWHAENAKDNPKPGIIQAIGHFNLGPNASPRDITNLSDCESENVSASSEIVRFFMFYERWRRAEVENSELYLASVKADCDSSGILIHPSGTELSLCDAINGMRSYYGDKQGQKFRVWVDRVLSTQTGLDTWLVKFNKWELSGDDQQGCVITCIINMKDGVSGATYMHVHETWLEGSERAKDKSTWLF
uniref:sucrose-phosphate phosphatase n=1 Tax=Salix viminalis TaxID=40686 RepID=A0A6N2MTT3_SALVM